MACLDYMKKDPGCSQCYMIEGQENTHINYNKRSADWIEGETLLP